MSNRAAAEITKSLAISSQSQPSSSTLSPVREEPVFARAMGIAPSEPTLLRKVAKSNQLARDLKMYTSKHVYIGRFMDERASEVLSVRSPIGLLSELDEIQYLLKKRHQIKVSKHKIAVAALLTSFWDFIANDTTSPIYELLKEEE